MIDQQFGIHAEHAVQQVFVVVIRGAAYRASGDIAHGHQAGMLELLGIATPNPPEIGERTMIPEQPPV